MRTKKDFRQEIAYNPLDKKSLGISVADAMLARPIELLPPEHPFLGAGIYAIYYTGSYPAYQAISEKNRNKKFEAPIYVGKAIPSGARKGGLGLDIPPGAVLYNRLVEHAETIRQTSNLNIEDFCCRYLVVDDIWIPLGENLLIEMFSPVWNRVVDGFGNHDPGAGRYNQQRSFWDVLHPGRAWAIKCQPNKRTEKQILELIKKLSMTS